MKKLLFILLYILLGAIVYAFASIFPPSYYGYLGYCDRVILPSLRVMFKFEVIFIYSLVFLILLWVFNDSQRISPKLFIPFIILLLINLIYSSANAIEYPIVEKVYGGYLQADTIIFGTHPFYYFSIIHIVLLAIINFKYWKLIQEKKDIYYIIKALLVIALVVLFIGTQTNIVPEPCRG
jgi:hypothetical protein